MKNSGEKLRDKNDGFELERREREERDKFNDMMFEWRWERFKIGLCILGGLAVIALFVQLLAWLIGEPITITIH